MTIKRWEWKQTNINKTENEIKNSTDPGTWGLHVQWVMEI